jgi:hypothetical protein
LNKNSLVGDILFVPIIAFNFVPDMSKDALKDLVVGWANGAGSKTEMWLKILSKHQVDDLESLRMLEPDLFIRLLEKLDQPILCQHLRNWYRDQFPHSIF